MFTKWRQKPNQEEQKKKHVCLLSGRNQNQEEQKQDKHPRLSHTRFMLIFWQLLGRNLMKATPQHLLSHISMILHYNIVQLDPKEEACMFTKWQKPNQEEEEACMFTKWQKPNQEEQKQDKQAPKTFSHPLHVDLLAASWPESDESNAATQFSQYNNFFFLQFVFKLFFTNVKYEYINISNLYT